MVLIIFGNGMVMQINICHIHFRYYILPFDCLRLNELVPTEPLLGKE